MTALDVAGVVLAAVVGLWIGATVHELSHYVVLRLIGRSPELLWPAVESSTLRFAVEYDAPAEFVPIGVRIAAVAPMIVGVGFGAPVVIIAATISKHALAAAICGLIWTAKLSAVDRAAARGQATL